MVIAVLAVVVGITLVTLLAIAAAWQRRTQPAGSRDSSGGDVAWMSSAGTDDCGSADGGACGADGGACGGDGGGGGGGGGGGD